MADISYGKRFRRFSHWRFRSYGTGKLIRAADLDLDKNADSQYSLTLGGFVRGRAKSPKNGDVKPLDRAVGVKKAGLLALRLGVSVPSLFLVIVS